MNKIMNVRLIIASALIALGVVLFIVVMALNGWDFRKLGTVKYETNTHEITEDFSDISVKTDTADILFLPADDGKCKVICHEAEHEKHAVEVKDGALLISVADERKWYEYVGFSFDSPKITVYLPKNEYAALSVEESTGDIEIPNDFAFSDVNIALSTGNVTFLASAASNVTIKATTGNVRVENTAAESIFLTVTTGKTHLLNVRCQNLTSNGSTGKLDMKNVVVSGKLSAERSTGDINFEGCDAAELFFKTSTGDVQGTLLSPKTFYTKTNTGEIDVPSPSTGGNCEISTSTGDIFVRIV